MEVVIKEDNTDLEKELRESKALLDDGIDISKFLREDLSINLELLEVAISLLVNTKEIFHVGGIEDYYKLRKIENNIIARIEESKFIYKFIETVANEFSETGKKEIYLNK